MGVETQTQKNVFFFFPLHFISFREPIPILIIYSAVHGPILGWSLDSGRMPQLLFPKTTFVFFSDFELGGDSEISEKGWFEDKTGSHQSTT